MPTLARWHVFLTKRGRWWATSSGVATFTTRAGLANVVAALQTGVTRFDACLAGIGGCPHAPGASGNVSTEDLAYMLHTMQIDTGINVSALLDLRKQVAAWLDGEALHGTLWMAGLPKTLQPVQIAMSV